MRALGFFLADLALRTATTDPRPAPVPEDYAVWTEARAAAWRRWRIEGERDHAALRAGRAMKVRVSRPFRAGPWLPMILGLDGSAG